jgi:hypothetical protein
MRILCNILVVLFVTTTAVGQQINPVPDYIFRNSMSVGRNAPTDTSAYFSIGPRFGATRGFMPPMVTDTASVTGTKRNGLLIYSIQRNSFLYWDSTGSRWSRIAANLDTLLLSTRAWRQKGDDSLAAIINTRTDTVNRLSTKAWRQKGIDSVVTLVGSGLTGTGISGYVPKWTGAKALDTSQIYISGPRTGIGTASPLARLHLLPASGATAGLIIEHPQSTPSSFGPTVFYVTGNGQTTSGSNNSEFAFLVGGPGSGSTNDGPVFLMRGNTYSRNANQRGYLAFQAGNVSSPTGLDGALAFASQASYIEFQTGAAATGRVRVTNAGETLFGTTIDAGDYVIQAAGNIYSTTGGLFAASSGQVGIGAFTGTPSRLLHLRGPDAPMTIESTGSGVSKAGLLRFRNNISTDAEIYQSSSDVSSGGDNAGGLTISVSNRSIKFMNNSILSGQITTNNEWLLGTESDAGAYVLQVGGAIYNASNVAIAQGNDVNLYAGNSATKVNLWYNSTNTGAQQQVTRTISTNVNLLKVGYLQHSADAFGSYIGLGKTRGGTNNTDRVESEDVLGIVTFQGSDSTNLVEGASIQALVDGTPGNDDMPTRLQFTTTPDGSATSQIRMVIKNNGRVGIGVTSPTEILDISGNVLLSGSIKTGAPSGGTAQPWKLGTVATVSPTSPNRTIEVEVNGTIYYLHAKTTND